MKTLLKSLAITLLLFVSTNPCIAGPAVVPHEKSSIVKVWDSHFVLVEELADPKKIKVIQDAFLRAKRVGDTSSHLKASTHKIDFSDRWLLDIKSGEIGVLSKAVVDVYQIDSKDLEVLHKLFEAEK